ncbi:MAG TPA: Gfo/Idh/MocA family oxidoreductase [Ignavibacteria bacterium]|nr:Gfo/Idh/MocA family oxidoreductase [Ignavibacteria bacterium]
MSKYKVCIIGCGDIGFLFDHNKNNNGALSHFKAFNDSENFEIAGIADTDSDIRNIIKHEYKTDVYENYKEMCFEKKPDVIVVATGDETHFEILKNIIDYKPKLVFCEKPLTLDPEEAKIITGSYRSKNILLQVNFTRRFLEEFCEIENMITEKSMGEIESVTLYYSRGLIHNASHYLDLVNRYFSDPINDISVVSIKKGLHKNDDTISFDMTCSNGMEIRFIGLGPTKLSFAEVDFIGTKGRIRINYRNEIEKYRITENKTFSGYSSYELYETKAIGYQKALPNAVENIYKTLIGKEELKSPADQSLKVFELVNRIREKA